MQQYHDGETASDLGIKEPIRFHCNCIALVNRTIEDIMIFTFVYHKILR